jgi:hypothetical protein
LLAKKILVGLILILFFAFATLGQENDDSDEPEFLIDKSDLTQILNAKSFQLQAGLSYSQIVIDDSTLNQFSIPSFIARYGLSNNFTIQAKSECDFNEISINDSVVNNNDELGYALIGMLYQVSQEKRIIFFDQITFGLTNIIPFHSTYNFSTEFDMIFLTNLSNRFSLEYGIGYVYQKYDDDLNILFELEGYISRNICCSIAYQSNRVFEVDAQSIQHLIAFELDFMTLSNYQIDILYTLGINDDYSYIGSVFVYTF